MMPQKGLDVRTTVTIYLNGTPVQVDMDIPDQPPPSLTEADVRVPTGEILPRGEYIRLQMELMLTAFRMGITDVCTFMIGPERWDATLMYEGVFDGPVQHHEMTHNQKGDGFRQLQKIDRFVRRNTTDRFGPVRVVSQEPDNGLVLEVAFEGLQRSPRHKSGVAMRFPRINRLRWDKPPKEADRLETLERMLERGGSRVASPLAS